MFSENRLQLFLFHGEAKSWIKHMTQYAKVITQIAKFMGPTWGPPGTCRPQMGPMMAPWIMLSGKRTEQPQWASFQYKVHLSRYRDPQYKTVVRASYPYNGNFLAGKTACFRRTPDDISRDFLQGCISNDIACVENVYSGLYEHRALAWSQYHCITSISSTYSTADFMHHRFILYQLYY